MNPWLQNVIAKATALAGQTDGLADFRAQALAKLQDTAWPTRKTEAWRYTSLKALETAEFESAKADADVQITNVADQATIDMVFSNGQLYSDLSGLTLPEGLSLFSLAKATDDQHNTAKSILSNVKPEHHLFGLINDALLQDALVIDVADGAQISTPVRIINLIQDGCEGHTRVLCRIGKQAKLTVLEQMSSDNSTSFNTLVSEFVIQPEAQLEHYRFALQSGADMSVGGCHFALNEKAKLNSTFVGYGSALARSNIDILHKGEYADAKLNAIYLLKDDERFDLHATVEHEVPNCTTEENVRGIVGDTAQATFNGRIHIHRDAQKTLAELNNRNLLLSDKAQINTKPELEIYADDVRCAHGATVAELDDEALYYLTSRGVSKEKALVMLNFGFINALVDDMPNQAIAEWLREQLQARFALMGE